MPAVGLLYYWRPDDYGGGRGFGAGFHLNQGTAVLHHVDVGDSVWVFTRNGEGRYVLAAELVVRAKTRNAPGFRYGPYRVRGDLSRSRYFAVDGQADEEAVLRGVPLSGSVGPNLGRREKSEPSRFSGLAEKKGTGKPEPMAMAIEYGKGRCFNLVLGHTFAKDPSPGFVALLTRGTEWAATGEVKVKTEATKP